MGEQEIRVELPAEHPTDVVLANPRAATALWRLVKHLVAFGDDDDIGPSVTRTGDSSGPRPAAPDSAHYDNGEAA